MGRDFTWDSTGLLLFPCISTSQNFPAQSIQLPLSNSPRSAPDWCCLSAALVFMLATAAYFTANVAAYECPAHINGIKVFEANLDTCSGTHASHSRVARVLASSPGPNFSQRKTQMNETAKNEGLVSIAGVINGTHA